MYVCMYVYIYINVSVAWTILEHQTSMRLTGLSQLIRLTRPVFHTWIAIFLCTGAIVSALRPVQQSDQFSTNLTSCPQMIAFG